MTANNFITVVFIQDYATKKKAEEFSCDGMLATSLINLGVAKMKKEQPLEKRKNKKS